MGGMGRRGWFAATAICCALGCAKPVEFTSNRVYALKLEKESDSRLDQALTDSHWALQELLGTPDVPKWPFGEESSTSPTAALPSSLVRLDRLQQAAGAVSSNRTGKHTGLFREHCSSCHGVSGDGRGPVASFQNPYPRDFRAGIFKFKSTERNARPTRADVLAVLRNGIRGTAMPSFALIDPEDLEALADYVIYLSIRGELERELLRQAAYDIGYEATELAAEERLVAPEAQATNPQMVKSQLAQILETGREIVGRWETAAERVASVPESFLVHDASEPQESGASLPTDDATSATDSAIDPAAAARGQVVFNGNIANCHACHGKDGVLGQPVPDFDDWTKEWTLAAGITPAGGGASKTFRRAGAFPPRTVLPRDLRQGVFRGGSDPATLARRISQGIAGTPMPAASLASDTNPVGLTETQLADLVAYVKLLASQNVKQQKLARRPPDANLKVGYSFHRNDSIQ